MAGSSGLLGVDEIRFTLPFREAITIAAMADPRDPR
jgi:hypothetical protein